MLDISETSRTLLLQLARRSLRTALAAGGAPVPREDDLPADLRQRAGVFVTLWREGRLRGCVGSIEPRAPLALEVMWTAVSSATEDSRFPPVAPEEVDGLDIEISVLSPLRRIASTSDIIPGHHGVLVRRGRRRGLFLPQVWAESGWDRDRFLRELCERKAGLDPDAAGAPETEWYVFEATVIRQPPK